MRAETSKTELGRRQRQRRGGGKGKEAMETQAMVEETAVSLSWLDDGSGDRAAAPAQQAGSQWSVGRRTGNRRRLARARKQI